jgi:phenylacetate-CoA ligase
MSITKKIYDNSPVPVQHLLASSQGLAFEALRWDRAELRRQYEHLLVSQWWPLAKLQEASAAQLSSHLAFAAEAVPYYADQEWARRLRSGREITLDDIPVLEKSDLRGNEDAFVSTSQQGRLVKLYTSGTTGTPISLRDDAVGFARRSAFIARLRTWAGVPQPLRPRRVQFTGRDLVPNRSTSPVCWRSNVPGNALLMSTCHISPTSIAAIANRMVRYKPDLIDGYPSAIAAVARLATAERLPLPRPTAVIVTAETLFDEDRALISDAFGCPVFNQYAASEPSCFWSDCEFGSLHMSLEYGMSEILRPDGGPAGFGESGDVVVTSFQNRVMPLIRYRLGDLAVLGDDQPCKCGRALPRVASVLGRRDDVLEIPGRGSIGRLDPIFKGLTAIHEAQIIQTGPLAITAKVVPGQGYSAETEKALIENLVRKVGQSVAIEVVRCSEIERGANGKFRAVVKAF